MFRDTARVIRALPGVVASPDRRYAAQWIASQRKGWLLAHRRPWLNFAATRFIEQHLVQLTAPSVFEFGSGASTLFWLDRGARLTSVEHDAAWYEQVRDLLPPDATVDYRLIPPEDRLQHHPFDPSDPALCQSGSSRFRTREFRSYVAQIDGFADSSLDVVLVDGRARASCMARAAPKVKQGGLLVLDNADRTYYLPKWDHAAHFDRHSFEGICPGLLEPTRTDVFTALH